MTLDGRSCDRASSSCVDDCYCFFVLPEEPVGRLLDRSIQWSVRLPCDDPVLDPLVGGVRDDLLVVDLVLRPIGPVLDDRLGACVAFLRAGTCTEWFLMEWVVTDAVFAPSRPQGALTVESEERK